jgi:hypothetical protein
MVARVYDGDRGLYKLIAIDPKLGEEGRAPTTGIA